MDNMYSLRAKVNSIFDVISCFMHKSPFALAIHLNKLLDESKALVALGDRI